MFTKDLNIGFLLDFYGDVLTERRRDALDFYYNNDMSLSEIAEEMGISRQGVRDLIKKAEEELFFYEEKLGLAKRFEEIAQSVVTNTSIVAILGCIIPLPFAIPPILQVTPSISNS